MRVSPFTILFCVMAGFGINACTPEISFPSPLEGVFVNDQTFEAQETTERVIEVNSILDGVEAVSIDTSTNEIAKWLTVGISSRKIKLKPTSNDTICNRKALVHLYYAGSRTDLRDVDLTVDFYVSQKGLDVEQEEDIPQTDEQTE